MKPALPRNVFEKSGTYWYVKAIGTKRKWLKLCRVKEGLPAMYLALAKLTSEKALDEMMPKLIATWQEEVGKERGEKTQANDRYMMREIAEGFAEFRANQVKSTDVVDFLKQFKKMPRTFNAYRAAVRELMRFAEEKGYREPESNPCASIKTMKVKARDRYITDSELRRIKFAMMYGKKGGTNAKRVGEKANRALNRSGHTMCCIIDMAYLTGQRVGDLLLMEWADVKQEGIYFEPGKVEGSTGIKILIQWTPSLRAVVERLRNPPVVPGRKGNKKPVSLRWMFSTLKGQPYTYSAINSAWSRARERAKIANKNVHFHDVRAKALTDVDEDRDIKAAQSMGGHSTQAQTAGYIRHKRAKKTVATR
jgi:integrase